jgi:RNA polymerase sigma factor (sigma-70 family)
MDDDIRSRRDRHRPFWAQTCVEFYQRLTSYASRLTNGKNYDAADLVQETVSRVLSYPPSPEEIANPLSYLLTVLRNVWSGTWRRQHTAETESLEPLLGTEALNHLTVEPDVFRILENEELLKEMSVKKGPLTPREELLLALYLQGLKCKEMAALLKENQRLISADLNAMLTKVRYRLQQ